MLLGIRNYLEAHGMRKIEISMNMRNIFFAQKKANFVLLGFFLPNLCLFLFCRDLFNYFL
jgi:hypothetical protein